MKLSGTVPDDLGLWVKEKIGSGEFYNTSHALQIALSQLKQNSEGRSPDPHGTAPPNGNGKKGKGS
jgi:Arc/MetJ-type ribon-helix-helix transcriptional regulator